MAGERSIQVLVPNAAVSLNVRQRIWRREGRIAWFFIRPVPRERSPYVTLPRLDASQMHARPGQGSHSCLQREGEQSAVVASEDNAG